MRKTILSVALMVLIGGPEAFAQSGSSSVSKNSDKPLIQAPVGIGSHAPATCPTRKT